MHVFLKVLNEKIGYSGDHPHIAHMERHLDEKGKLETFHKAFQREAGASWLEERDAWEFRRDEVATALREPRSKVVCMVVWIAPPAVLALATQQQPALAQPPSTHPRAGHP